MGRPRSPKTQCENPRKKTTPQLATSCGQAGDRTPPPSSPPCGPSVPLDPVLGLTNYVEYNTLSTRAYNLQGPCSAERIVRYRNHIHTHTTITINYCHRHRHHKPFDARCPGLVRAVLVVVAYRSLSTLPRRVVTSQLLRLLAWPFITWMLLLPYFLTPYPFGLLSHLHVHNSK